jgi:hypothetical protein
MDQQVQKVETKEAQPGGPIEKVSEFENRPDSMRQIGRPCRSGMDRPIIHDHVVIVELERPPK